MIRSILLLSLALAAGAASANEAAIRRALEPKLGGAKIEAVRPSPINGLFEVQFRAADGAQIVYTDPTGTMVIQGKIYDIKSDRAITDDQLRKLNAIKFESMPLDQAVKIKRGNGSRVLAMFSDPYCPACRQFERELAKVDNVTLYVFMYPVIRPQNKDHSKSVWCSADRQKAWIDLAAGQQPKIPEAAPTCSNPVDKVVAYGRTIGVNSTPTLIFSNGERVSGGLPAQDLSEMLDQVQVAKKP